MKTHLLYATAAILGAALLTMDVLGARILNPICGDTLLGRSLLISVLLFFLSLGLIIGSRQADKRTSLFRLGRHLAGAGLWMMLIPFLKQSVFTLGKNVSTDLAGIVLMLILFVPPFYLLGLAFINLIKAKASVSENISKTVGSILFTTLIAGAASAPLINWRLLPALGISKLAVITGGCLLLAAMLAFRLEHQSKLAVPVTGSILLLGLASPFVFPKYFSPGSPSMLTSKQSAYAEISITEEAEQRYLLINGVRYGAVNTRVGKPINSYVVALDLVKNFFDKSGDALIIGLGTGSTAQLFVQDRWHVDILETDSMIVKYAQDQFGFDPARSNLIRMSVRQFLLTRQNLYDVIIIDIFASSSIPFHLLTKEAFALARSHLTAQGVLAINTLAVGWDHGMVKSLAATLGTCFSEVIALPTSEPPNVLGNIILFAANRKLDFPSEWIGHPLEFIDDPYAHWAVVQRNHAWDNRFVPDSEGAKMLSDDLNPSELWIAEIIRAVRGKNADQIGREIWH